MEDSIYCPKCGTQSSGDRRFCRSCGIDLLPINRFLGGQEEITSVENGERRQKLLRQGAFLAWGGWVLSAVLAILGVAMQRLDDDVGQFLTILSAVGGPFLITGLAMLAYAKFILKEPMRSSPSLKSVSRNQLPGEAFSVTEGTTELFENEKIEIAARDTAPQNR